MRLMWKAIAVLSLSLIMATSALAAAHEMTCSGKALSFSLAFNPVDSTCRVDDISGRYASTRAGFSCNYDDPKLRLLSVAITSEGLTFVHENTQNGRVEKGLCAAAGIRA